MKRKLDSCRKCGEFIEKGVLCLECAKNALEGTINRQLIVKSNKIGIPIGDLPAKETSDIITSMLDKNPNVIYLELKARGRHITRAVDVLEILKRELKMKLSIKTNTEELTSRQGVKVKVSEILITLQTN